MITYLRKAVYKNKKETKFTKNIIELPLCSIRDNSSDDVEIKIIVKKYNFTKEYQ